MTDFNPVINAVFVADLKVGDYIVESDEMFNVYTSKVEQIEHNTEKFESVINGDRKEPHYRSSLLGVLRCMVQVIRNEEEV